MTKPIEDAANALAIRTALGVPTNAELAAVSDVANAAYVKPADGIPHNDLHTGIRDQLDLADTALQPGALPVGTTVTAAQISDAGAAGRTLLKKATLPEIQYLVSGAALRSRKIILFGDSRTNDSEFTDALNRMSTNFSWFDYGNFVAGSVLDPVNKGIGGNTTAQMRARFQADVLDEKPAYMTIMAGTNNSLLTIAAADSAYADMEYMITTAVASGIRTFCVSETTGSAPLRAAPYPAIVQYYNDKLRNLCNSLRGADFWDFNSLIIDPANASGLAKTGANRDGLHFSALSASRIGRDVVAPALKGLGLSSLTQLINGLQDTLGNNTYVTQILSNPLYATATGGTITGASNSGVLPSGVTGSGSPTTVFSVPARADGIGNNIRASSTATASSTVFISQSITASRVVGGGIYVIEGSLDIQNPVSVFRVPVGLQFSDGTSTYKYSWGQASMSAVAGDGLVPMSGVFRSRPFAIPSVTVTSASLEMAVAFSAAGSATVDFGRMSIRRVG